MWRFRSLRNVTIERPSYSESWQRVRERRKGSSTPESRPMWTTRTVSGSSNGSRTKQRSGGHAESDRFERFETELPELLAGEPEVTRFAVESATDVEL
jgi:hypothetical protein